MTTGARIAARRLAATAVLIAAMTACERDYRLGSDGWPERAVRIDVDLVRANPQMRQSIPLCRDMPPPVLADSVGPLRAGQSLAEARAACPEHVLAWDWGPADIPTPAFATRMGDAVVIALLNDTLPGAYVMEVTTADLATPEGLGAGSPLDDLIDEFGSGQLLAGACVLEIVFDSRPGLSFLLGWQTGLVSCEEIEEIAADNALDRVPIETFVRQVTQYVARSEAG